jgi:hypothetical protein
MRAFGLPLSTPANSVDLADALLGADLNLPFAACTKCGRSTPVSPSTQQGDSWLAWMLTSAFQLRPQLLDQAMPSG